MKLSKDDIEFLDGLLIGLADNMSDGAAGAMEQDAVASCGKWPNRDPHDVWMAWMERNVK